jgi:hypothetical protein
MVIAVIIVVGVLISGGVALARQWASRTRRPGEDRQLTPASGTQRLILEEWREGELVMIGTVLADARDPLKVIEGTAGDTGGPLPRGSGGLLDFARRRRLKS